MFAVVTGEEKGRLGSRYYLTHPTAGPLDIRIPAIRFEVWLFTCVSNDEIQGTEKRPPQPAVISKTPKIPHPTAIAA